MWHLLLCVCSSGTDIVSSGQSSISLYFTCILGVLDCWKDTFTPGDRYYLQIYQANTSIWQVFSGERRQHTHAHTCTPFFCHGGLEKIYLNLVLTETFLIWILCSVFFKTVFSKGPRVHANLYSNNTHTYTQCCRKYGDTQISHPYVRVENLISKPQASIGIWLL